MKKSTSGHEMSKLVANGSSGSLTSNGGYHDNNNKQPPKLLTSVRKYFRATNGNSNHTGNQLWPVLTILRLGGTLPLSVNEKKDGGGAKFTVWNMYALQAITTGSLFVYWWWSVLASVATESRWETFKLSLDFPFDHLISLTQPIAQISQVLFGWLTARQMAEYLNTWQTFETNFAGVFKETYKYKFRMRRMRDFLIIFYVILPSLLCFQRSELFLTSEATKANPALLVVLMASLIFFSLMEDVKVLLMLFATEGSFKELRNAMIAQYKGSSSLTKTPLGPEKVKQWIQLLTTVRNQHRFACKIQAPQQLVSISATVVMLACHLLLFIKSLIDHSKNQGPLNFVPIIMFTGLLGRLWLRCWMAEKAADEEQRIAQDLVQMESSGGNIFIKMEVWKASRHDKLYYSSTNRTITQLKFMYDLIVTKPTVTSYGNCIQLRQLLIIKLLGHVITFLLITMQLNISSKMGSSLIIYH